jgi:thiamine biosynthesis lipoprotein
MDKIAENKRAPRRVSGGNLYIMAVLLLGIAGTLALCVFSSRDAARTVTREGVAMDTLIRVTATAALSKGDLNAALDDAFSLIGDIEKKISMYDPDSEISRINARAGEDALHVSPETFSVVRTALDVAEVTDGAYDPTIGPVTSLWSVTGGGEHHPPAAGEIKSAVSLVGWKAAETEPPDLARLSRRGAALDMGGIGKGYASYRVAESLKRAGVGSALIDLGGNVVVIGARPDGGRWRIGIQNPLKARGVPLVSVELGGGSVITSGVCERFFDADGVRYTHIFNPSTGLPLAGSLLSVTIVSEDPAEGDALSTAFMVMGLDAAIDVMRILPGVEAVFVYDSEDRGREVTATSGLRDSIKLMDDEWTLSFVDIF